MKAVDSTRMGEIARAHDDALRELGYHSLLERAESMRREEFQAAAATAATTTTAATLDKTNKPSART